MDLPTPQHQIPWTEYARRSSRVLAESYHRTVIVRPYRKMLEFAEQELILPDGPYQGQRFRRQRQPAHALFFSEVDSGRWFRHACTGPQQSGKTLAFVVVPIMYHLFERCQTVLFGLPSMDMANDKWKLDIRPAIEASQYGRFLPRKGSGSQGGTPELIQFSNGANLKFITGGGGDEKRAGITGPVLVVTEVSHLDSVGGTSDEATKLKQMEGRVRAYRASGQARIYLESTVTVEEGRMWQEYINGSQSEVVFPCHSCEEHITIGRGNLVGWQDAKDESEAELMARWACPACGILFDDSTRNQQLQKCRLVHKGQQIDSSGNITGDLPRTKTLGFRYSAGTNMFMTAGIVGADEYRAMREVDQDNSEKELLQWTWALPAKPKQRELEPLDWKTVMMRQSSLKRGVYPHDTVAIGAGCDVRNEQLDWFVIAKRANGQPLCIDYGFEPVHRELTGDLQTAIKQAIKLLQDKFDKGWQHESSGVLRGIDMALIDEGYETDTVRDAIGAHQLWATAKGFGFKQHGGERYNPPSKPTREVLNIGEGWHDVSAVHRGRRHRMFQNNADHWKRRVHQALSASADSSAALLLPKSDKPDGRAEVAKQLTAEKEQESFEVGKGNVRKFVPTFSRNHFLDAAYMAMIALNIVEHFSAKAAQKNQNKNNPAVISGKKAAPFVRKQQ